MKKTLILIAVITVSILAIACQAAPPPAPPEQAQPEQAQPETQPETENAPAENAPAENAEEKIDTTAFPNAFSSVDLHGEDVDASIFADYDLTMINIWATYCEPCIMEMEYLGEMSAEMPEGTQLVGLVGDVLDAKTFDLAVSIAEKTGADFPHLVPDKALYTYLYYNVAGFPTTVFVDSEGKLVGDQLIGVRSREDYEAELQERLNTLK